MEPQITKKTTNHPYLLYSFITKLSQNSFKKFIILTAVLLFLMVTIKANFSVIIEAEDGTLNGATVQNSLPGYTGTGYTGNYFNNTDYLSVTTTIPKSKLYTIQFTYLTEHNTGKECIINVNGQELTSFEMSNAPEFKVSEGIVTYLNAGEVTIKIDSYWGGYFIDNVIITEVPERSYEVDSTLINPNANEVTYQLYNYLRSTYGEYILAGHTLEFSEDIATATGKAPIVMAYDLAPYSPMYAYAWDNDLGHVFGPADYKITEQVIADYSNSNGKVIPTIQWHWYSPSQGTLAEPTFYSEYTSFDVSKAVTEGTTEYSEVIRDIDAIAVQLQRLEDANIPIIWRPLHEADGAWFWWGMKGAAVTLKLYDMMYDRLTNYHGLDNLIWCWSRAYEDGEWYPGNDKVDIYGMDSYPGNENYTTRREDFVSMYNRCNGRKILAMTENGPIPDIDGCVREDVMWSYFVTWTDHYQKENSVAHVKQVYVHDNVITLDERSTPPITPGPTGNHTPVIELSYSPTAISGATVTIDASRSSDQDGDDLTYNWSSSNNINLLSTAGATTSFVAPTVTEPTSVNVTLRLSDGSLSANRTITITINPANTPPTNQKPVIVLDYTTTAQSSSFVSLDASASYDDDNDPLSYQWSSTDNDVIFTSTMGSKTTFIAPTVTEIRVINVTLTVSDGTETVTRGVNISILPSQTSGKDNPPVVIVNYEINTYSGRVTELDASESFDIEQKPITFLWTSEEDLFLSSSTAPVISFLAPDVAAPTAITFKLTVSDGTKTSERDIEINVVPFKPEYKEVGILSVKASGYEEDNYPENIIDNDKSTAWKIRGNEQWLVLELGKPIELSHFKLSVTNGIDNNAYFNMYGSNDGFDWDLVMGQEESCGLSIDYEVYDIPVTKAETAYNYVKLIGKGTSKDDLNSYSELKLYTNSGALDISEKISPQNLVKIYPNPAYSVFNLDLKEDSNVRILDISGKNVFEQQMQQGVNPVNINLTTGTYMVQVLSKNKMVTQKLIIK